MIIDTGKLIQAIENAEEIMCQKLYGGDYGKASMAFLNSSEKRQIGRTAMVHDVEQLALRMLEIGAWPIDRVETEEQRCVEYNDDTFSFDLAQVPV